LQGEADLISKHGAACKEVRETRYWLRPFAATGIVSAKMHRKQK